MSNEALTVEKDVEEPDRGIDELMEGLEEGARDILEGNFDIKDKVIREKVENKR